ncbi:MAG: PTS sugar transporter subunit IIA [Brevinema sp.]
MVHIVLSSHGTLAQELKNTASMVMGLEQNIDILEFSEGMGIESFRKKAENLFASLEGNPIIILCDLKNGTPFNICAEYVMRHSHSNSAILCYGMSLPMLIAAIETRESDTPFEQWQEIIINITKEQSGYFSQVPQIAETENEEF